MFNRDNMRNEHQALLVDRDVLRGRREGLSRNGFHVHNRYAADAGNFAMDRAGMSNRGESNHCGKRYEQIVVSSFADSLAITGKLQGCYQQSL